LLGTVCDNLDNTDGDMLLYWRYECFRCVARAGHIDQTFNVLCLCVDIFLQMLSPCAADRDKAICEASSFWSIPGYTATCTAQSTLICRPNMHGFAAAVSSLHSQQNLISQRLKVSVTLPWSLRQAGPHGDYDDPFAHIHSTRSRISTIFGRRRC